MRSRPSSACSSRPPSAAATRAAIWFKGCYGPTRRRLSMALWPTTAAAGRGRSSASGPCASGSSDTAISCSYAAIRYLPASPYISPELTTAHHISPHLTASHHISPHLTTHLPASTTFSSLLKLLACARQVVERGWDVFDCGEGCEVITVFSSAGCAPSPPYHPLVSRGLPRLTLAVSPPPAGWLCATHIHPHPTTLSQQSSPTVLAS